MRAKILFTLKGLFLDHHQQLALKIHEFLTERGVGCLRVGGRESWSSSYRSHPDAGAVTAVLMGGKAGPAFAGISDRRSCRPSFLHAWAREKFLPGFIFHFPRRVGPVSFSIRIRWAGDRARDR